MENFFGLSVKSTKSVPGKKFAKITAFSKGGDRLGELEVKVHNGEGNFGIFVKYMPSEDADSTVKIAKLIITSKEKENVKELLKKLSDVIKENMSSDTGENPFMGSMSAMLLTTCIIPESGTILIPQIFDISITNALICRYISGEWFGIKMKMSPEIQTFIKNLADEKRQEQSEADDEADFFS
jgi:hypothetical protein